MVIHFLLFLLLLLRANCFLLSVCSLVSFSLSDCVRKNYSSSGTSDEDVVTSIGVVCISSRISRRIFSVVLRYCLERNSAAVQVELTMCAIFKLSFNTSILAFHSDGGMALFWKKKHVTTLLPVKMFVGLVASHKVRANSKNALYFVETSFE